MLGGLPGARLLNTVTCPLVFQLLSSPSLSYALTLYMTDAVPNATELVVLRPLPW